MIERYTLLLVVFVLCVGMLATFVLEMIEWYRDRKRNRWWRQ